MQKQQAIIYGRQSRPSATNEQEATHQTEIHPIRVFIYCRLAQKDDQRMDEQVRACRNFYQEKGYRGVAIFQTFGSGNTLDNEMLSRMRERYDEVDAVVVYGRERLSRNINLYQALVEEMQQHNVKLICIKEI